MKLTELPRLLSPTRWAIVGGILLLAFVAIWFVLTEPGRQRQKAAEARVASELSQAAAGSARDAVGTVTKRADTEAQIDRSTTEAEDAIRQAPDDQRNAVALARLCLRDAYASDPACVQLRRSRAP